ncbi:hypothetical protein BST13_04465 [Mycobacterium aquaticum]|uniref:Uncharacterized protein n=1 Tax=Mycobacterium aquaticum TaxID=1927124 RepID=A0A1X0B8M9_9MYCO|nr:hypothetical protein BST13_04465 [Mycobacterium aquaticum]
MGWWTPRTWRPSDEPLGRRAEGPDEPLGRRAEGPDEPLGRRAERPGRDARTCCRPCPRCCCGPACFTATRRGDRCGCHGAGGCCRRCAVGLVGAVDPRRGCAHAQR